MRVLLLSLFISTTMAMPQGYSYQLGPNAEPLRSSHKQFLLPPVAYVKEQDPLTQQLPDQLIVNDEPTELKEAEAEQNYQQQQLPEQQSLQQNIVVAEPEPATTVSETATESINDGELSYLKELVKPGRAFVHFEPGQLSQIEQHSVKPEEEKTNEIPIQEINFISQQQQIETQPSQLEQAEQHIEQQQPEQVNVQQTQLERFEQRIGEQQQHQQQQENVDVQPSLTLFEKRIVQQEVNEESPQPEQGLSLQESQPGIDVPATKLNFLLQSIKQQEQQQQQYVQENDQVEYQELPPQQQQPQEQVQEQHLQQQQQQTSVQSTQNLPQPHESPEYQPQQQQQQHVQENVQVVQYQELQKQPQLQQIQEQEQQLQQSTPIDYSTQNLPLQSQEHQSQHKLPQQQQQQQYQPQNEAETIHMMDPLQLNLESQQQHQQQTQILPQVEHQSVQHQQTVEQSSSHQQPSSNAVHYNKEFFFLSAAPDDPVEPKSLETEMSKMRKNLRVVFIRAPEQNNINKALVQLAKQSVDSQTAIYVLSKQHEIADLANQIQQARAESHAKPEVVFVKYKTPEEAEQAQRTIQAQYEALDGPNHVNHLGPALSQSFVGVTSTESHKVE